MKHYVDASRHASTVHLIELEKQQRLALADSRERLLAAAYKLDTECFDKFVPYAKRRQEAAITKAREADADYQKLVKAYKITNDRLSEFVCNYSLA